jgi:AraC-like DNA-binding protein
MCDHVSPIFQAIEYIEGHLQEDITVAQIAEATGYSLFHFMRKFNQTVHHTPYDYLMRRRLTEAAKALIHSNQRIIDIGQDYCFHDQETFSRVFRKMFQMTPSQCRKEKSVLPQQLMQARTIEELLFINGSHFDPPAIVELKELHLIGLMTVLDEGKSKGDLQREWVFADLKSECRFKSQSMIYELAFQIHSHYYFIGLEEASFIEIKPQLARQKIMGGRFVKMNVPESQIQLATRYIHSTWIAGNGLVGKNDLTVIRWSYEKNLLEPIKTLLIPIE